MKWLQKRIQGIDERTASRIMIVVFIVSLLPLLLLARYCFPQADDYTFSARTHMAWISTGSLWEVLKTAILVVGDYYMKWQGTYFSIFLMTLQPGLFTEKLYWIVPFFMMSISSGSVLFFCKVILRDCLKISKEKYIILSVPIIFVMIQRMIDGMQAFYWYNGATHYMTVQSLLFFLMGILLQMVFVNNNKRIKRTGVLVIFLSICVGGGNYISAILAFVFYMAIIFLTIITKQWKTVKGKFIISGFILFTAGFLCNALAPGNATRQDIIGEPVSPIKAVLVSIYFAVEKIIEWNEWLLILIILLLIPVMWKAVLKVEFHFPYPIIVIGYCFGMVAAMFAPNVYTGLEYGPGRCLNITYMTYVLVLFFSVFYTVGWLANQFKQQVKEEFIENGYGNHIKWYWGLLGIAGIFFTIMTGVADYDYFLSSTAVEVIASGEAAQIREEYEEYLQLLLDEEQKDIIIHPFTVKPELLTSNGISPWQEGARGFFQKDSIIEVERTVKNTGE
ncbi:MAG: hypothetical protein R3Y24_04170 [Eubacteriales bacterium]